MVVVVVWLVAAVVLAAVAQTRAHDHLGRLGHPPMQAPAKGPFGPLPGGALRTYSERSPPHHPPEPLSCQHVLCRLPRSLLRCSNLSAFESTWKRSKQRDGGGKGRGTGVADQRGEHTYMYTERLEGVVTGLLQPKWLLQPKGGL